MSFQRGPGKGYHSAKEKVLKIEPSAVCKRENRAGIIGYLVYVGDKIICSDGNARDCWSKALEILQVLMKKNKTS